MEEKKAKWKKLKWLLIIPVLIVCTGGYMLWSGSGDDTVAVYADNEAENKEGTADNSAGEEGKENENDAASEDEDEPVAICIDVGGAVVAPHVVTLPEGSRIYEAVDAAGGLLSDAETKYMNMAAVCEDGAKIYVPTVAEVAEQIEEGGDTQLFSTDDSGQAGTAAGAQSTGDSSGKVNINTADADELQTLTGIGPSMAQRIIDYREANGSFSAPEELTNVSGIGEKTLAKFIENICV